MLVMVVRVFGGDVTTAGPTSTSVNFIGLEI
jgi:hypothetical protein